MSTLSSHNVILFRRLLLKLGLQAHFNSMRFSSSVKLLAVKDVEGRKSNISKNYQLQNTQGPVFVSQ